MCDRDWKERVWSFLFIGYGQVVAEIKSEQCLHNLIRGLEKFYCVLRFYCIRAMLGRFAELLSRAGGKRDGAPTSSHIKTRRYQWLISMRQLTLMNVSCR